MSLTLADADELAILRLNFGSNRRHARAHRIEENEAKAFYDALLGSAGITPMFEPPTGGRVCTKDGSHWAQRILHRVLISWRLDQEILSSCTVRPRPSGRGYQVHCGGQISVACGAGFFER